jgi:hypothetical protein
VPNYAITLTCLELTTSDVAPDISFCANIMQKNKHKEIITFLRNSVTTFIIAVDFVSTKERNETVLHFFV